MWFWKSRTYSSLGIAFSADGQSCFAQSCTTRGSELDAWVITRTHLETDFATAECRAWLKDKGFRPSKAVISVSSTQALVKKIAIPQGLNVTEQADLIQFDLDRLLPQSEEEYAVDFHPIRTRDGIQEMLLAGIRKQSVHEMIAYIAGLGLSVHAVDLDSTALLRGWQYCLQGDAMLSAETIMLVVAEQDRLGLYLFHDDLPVYSQSVARHSVNFGQQIESLFRMAQMGMNFAEHEFPVFCYGDAIACREAKHVLLNQLDVAQVISSDERIEHIATRLGSSELGECIDQQLFLAVGLALWKH